MEELGSTGNDLIRNRETHNKTKPVAGRDAVCPERAGFQRKWRQFVTTSRAQIGAASNCRSLQC